MKLTPLFFLISTFSLHTYAAEIGVPDLDDIEYPEEEAPSAGEVELGKMLFFDPRLSVNQVQSCATCHNPDLGFSDGMAKGLGSMGGTVGRNSPQINNLAWNVTFFWDGRAASLEEQALGPIQAPGEMNLPLEELVGRLKKVGYYRTQFDKVYGDSGISNDNIGKALASFERTLNSINSPFDRYMKGDKVAMSDAQVRGMALFKGKGNCTKCHDGANFTDNSFHNIGVNDTDPGRFKINHDKTMTGAFKTPGLRNILLSAPYMHNGSEGTLEEVVRFYNRGGDKKDNLDKLIVPLKLTTLEITDLVAFLGALTDPIIVERPTIPSQ